MSKNSKTIFCCQSCGYQTPKWMGKCPDCGQWQTFVKEVQASTTGRETQRSLSSALPKPVPMDSIDIENENRLLTSIKEFDRVLGGGLVSGSLVLIGGDPGIGKSTLMLQALN
ncbi:MAG: DNA repair protein RadA, partial [Deltaproteobacteria bacterium]|nr:DNA repair protein RadA [Deltaproteobacteria bacterium]